MYQALAFNGAALMPDRSGLQLVHAGPAYAAIVRLGLERAGEPRLGRRVLLSIGLTYGVLLLLSVAQGVALGDLVRVPFLKDYDAPAKFLVSLPLLLWGEIVAARRLGPATEHFIRAGLVAESDLPRYVAILAQARRLRDSWLAEAVILLLCAVASVTAYGVFAAGTVSDWRVIDAVSNRLSWAGWWLVVVAAPFYRFILFRWLWRFLIWAWFLWRTSRLDLRLVPAHADGAGGLAFVGRAELTFSVLIAASAVVLSADLAYATAHLEMAAGELKRSVAALVVLLTAVQFLPLLPFVRPLARANYRGLLEHGALISRHHRAFEAKWVHGPPPPDSELLGMPEAGSLADLPTGYEAAQRMHFVPVDRRLFLAFLSAAALPFSPLVLTQVSLAEVGRQLLHLAL